MAICALRSGRCLLAAVLFLGLGFWTVAAAAQSYPSLSIAPAVEQSGANDVAVIVAVENYLLLPDVRGAVSNANDWEVFFERGLGVPTVHFLSNTSATREEMIRFAERAAAEVGAGGTLWYVFIGHGAPAESGDDGLLVGVDAQQTPASLGARGLRQQELLDILNRGSQAQTVLVVDACFSGRDARGEALVEAQPVIPGNIRPQLGATTVVLSAAQSSEFAGPLPGIERPAFSYLLLGALRGWAEDGNGAVTAQSALNFTRRSLRDIPGRFDQTPSLFGTGDLVLVRGTNERDPGVSDVMRHQVRSSHGAGSAPLVGDTCPQGMERNVDTQGQCCWPGQVYLNDRCVGLPTSCPRGRTVSESAQACIILPCEGGRVRAGDGVNCCWEGQGWSTTRNQCVGVPVSCPEGTSVSGESCVVSGAVARNDGRFENITLGAAFLPDPAVLTGLAGGNNDARQLGHTSHGPCVGRIAANPDHRVTLSAHFDYLQFRVYSDEDTSLVINGPSGLMCNDDAVGLDPRIEGRFVAGIYEVYVGAVSNGFPEYRLEISEYQTPEYNSVVGTYGDLSLAAGFLPDPQELSGTAGGNREARQFGSTAHGPCAGNIAQNPDHVLHLTSSFEYLQIRGYSSEDISLVIEGPGGMLCNDDAVGLDPRIDGRFPAGEYKIYVGAVGGGFPDYRLEVSEYRP